MNGLHTPARAHLFYMPWKGWMRWAKEPIVAHCGVCSAQTRAIRQRITANTGWSTEPAFQSVLYTYVSSSKMAVAKSPRCVICPVFASSAHPFFFNTDKSHANIWKCILPLTSVDRQINLPNTWTMQPFVHERIPSRDSGGCIIPQTRRGRSAPGTDYMAAEMPVPVSHVLTTPPRYWWTPPCLHWRVGGLDCSRHSSHPVQCLDHGTQRPTINWCRAAALAGLVKSADLLTPSEPDAGSSAPDGNI